MKGVYSLKEGIEELDLRNSQVSGDKVGNDADGGIRLRANECVDLPRIQRRTNENNGEHPSAYMMRLRLTMTLLLTALSVCVGTTATNTDLIVTIDEGAELVSDTVGVALADAGSLDNDGSITAADTAVTASNQTDGDGLQTDGDGVTVNNNGSIVSSAGAGIIRRVVAATRPSSPGLVTRVRHQSSFHDCPGYLTG